MTTTLQVPILALATILLCLIGCDDLATAFAATVSNDSFRLMAFDREPGDVFGESTAIDGAIAVVGARYSDDAGSASGSAYLFDVTTGQELFKLTASDAAAGDAFGSSVATSGNIAVVTAPGDNVRRGSAYVFDVNNGQQLHKLTPDVFPRTGTFGLSVAVSGDIAIIGASTAGPGFAYVFDAMTGQQLFKLGASDPSEVGDFGRSVAISGNIAVVGARGDNSAGPASGAAYVFDVSTGQELFKLTASDADSGDEFGISVGVCGGMAIVGAWRDGDGFSTGSAYLFDVSTGSQVAKLTASDLTKIDLFGQSVAIAGNFAIVGAPAVRVDRGAAYLFNATTGKEVAKITAIDGESFHQFGTSVDIDGTTVIVAAPYKDNNTGLVYGYSVPEPTGLGLAIVAAMTVMGWSYLPIRRWKHVRRTS